MVNLACALLVKMTATEVKTIVLVRVTINDTLFVLCAISLSVCLYKVAKISLASIYLESKVGPSELVDTGLYQASQSRIADPGSGLACPCDPKSALLL